MRNNTEMIKNITVIAIFIAFATTASAAKNTPANIPAETNFFASSKNKDSSLGHPYLGVVAGVGFSKVGKQQEFQEIGNFPWEYSPVNNNSAAFLYGINGGYEFKLGAGGLLSFGIGVYQNTNYHSKGLVYEKGAPPALLLTYEYKLLSTRFMAETQFAWQFDLNKIKIIPFILLGAGPSLNFANSYKETEVVAAPNGASEFESKTNTGFAYQLGAGLAFPFNTERDRLFAAYRYIDLGKARFGTNSDQAHGDWSLDIGRTRSNEIYVGYTHLFGF